MKCNPDYHPNHKKLYIIELDYFNLHDLQGIYYKEAFYKTHLKLNSRI